jgi:hypothetical protein
MLNNYPISHENADDKKEYNAHIARNLLENKNCGTCIDGGNTPVRFPIVCGYYKQYRDKNYTCFEYRDNNDSW